MATMRTFVAVELAGGVRQQAAGLIERLRVSGAGVKWVEPEKMHLTLKFLGDVRDTEITDVCRAVDRAARDFGTFPLHCVRAGAFPNVDRPRTIWIGCAEGSDVAKELQERVETELESLGFRPERREFHPHITLGRVRRVDKALAGLTDLLKRHEAFDAGTTLVDEVVVMSSSLSRTGAEYTPLSHTDLGTN